MVKSSKYDEFSIYIIYFKGEIKDLPGTDSKVSPSKVKFVKAFDKILSNLQKTISLNDGGSESPVKKMIIRHKKTSIFEIPVEKIPEGCDGIPDVLLKEKKKSSTNFLYLINLREKYKFKNHCDCEKY